MRHLTEFEDECKAAARQARAERRYLIDNADELREGRELVWIFVKVPALAFAVAYAAALAGFI